MLKKLIALDASEEKIMGDQVKTIWKFVLRVVDFQVVSVPPLSQILTVQTQGDDICLWVLVDPNSEKRVDYPVWVHGTGHPVDDAVTRGRYVSTVQLQGGRLVFHVFVGLEVGRGD